jgi:hypothetical protein
MTPPPAAAVRCATSSACAKRLIAIAKPSLQHSGDRSDDLGTATQVPFISAAIRLREPASRMPEWILESSETQPASGMSR